MKGRLPTAEEIRVRAYQIYLERGCQPGHEIDDWLQAEYELTRLPVRKIAEKVCQAPFRASAGPKSLFAVIHHAVAGRGPVRLPAQDL